MLRVELGKTFHRPRTYVLAAALAVVAVIPSIAAASGGAGGPPFFEAIRRNGLFAGLTAVALIQPFFLPLGAALLSGESIASEASGGTLRYLLVRPVGRRRLVVQKYLSVVVLLSLSVAWVALVGLVAGGIAHGFGPLPTLSGTEISAGAALVRILGTALYAACGAAALAAIGMVFSTLTESGPGATVATLAVAIVSQILDNLPKFEPIHAFLPTHGWLAWPDLFRSPVAWNAIVHGLVSNAAYAAIFLAAALVRFSRKDVSS
jgi:ABC-2 type transport system permease protein